MPGGKETIATATKKLDELVFTEPDVELAKQTLLGLLSATVVVRGTGRTDAGSPIYEEMPDNPIRLAAAVKVIEWGKGKPKQMVEVQTNNPGARGSMALQELGSLLARNRDIADKVLSVLIEGAKVAEAIPVQAVTSESPAQPPESQSGASTSEARPSV